MQASKFTVKPLSKAPAKVISNNSAPVGEKQSRLRVLTTELRTLEQKLRLGGGPDKIERQHNQGKLTARERIDLLLDKDSASQEIGLLVAYDQYKLEGRRQNAEGREQVKDEIGQAPAAGVVTTIGRDHSGRRRLSDFIFDLLSAFCVLPPAFELVLVVSDE